MGYFSNGTEGEMYFDQWCANCVHDADGDCPVWAAHLQHNYRDCNDPESILHMLIPRSEDKLGNEKCRLHVARAAVGDLFEAEGGAS